MRAIPHADHRSDCHQQRRHPAPQSARFGGQGGHPLRPPDRYCEHIRHVKAGQDQPRYDRALIHIAHRSAQLIGQNDQHQRRRNDLRQGAGCRDDTGCHPPVITIAQHDGQGYQSHGNNRCRHNPGGGRQQRAHNDHGIGQTAADRAKQLPDRIQQILGHARPFQHNAHERKERDGQQGFIRHYPVKAQRHGAQQVPVKCDGVVGIGGKPNADGKKHQAIGSQRKRHRIAQQQKHNQTCEHNRRHVRGDKFQDHLRFSSSSARRATSAAKAAPSSSACS